MRDSSWIWPGPETTSYTRTDYVANTLLRNQCLVPNSPHQDQVKRVVIFALPGDYTLLKGLPGLLKHSLTREGDTEKATTNESASGPLQGGSTLHLLQVNLMCYDENPMKCNYF